MVYAEWLEVITGAGVVVFSFISRGKVTVSFGLRNWKQSLLTGILSISVYSVALSAITKMLISSVAVLRETSNIFAVLIGSYVLKQTFALSRVLTSNSVVTVIAYSIIL